MSWSFSAIGTADKIVDALAKESARQTGQCKVEFDAALPSLIGLVRENFDKDKPRLVRIEASGSGSTRNGEQHERGCTVKIERIWGELLV